MRSHNFVLSVAAALSAGACGDKAASDAAPASLPAVELYAQEALSSLPFRPVDVKAVSHDVMWLADEANRVVMRLDTPSDRYEMFGLKDDPPVEVVNPARIAVRPDIGVMTYDLDSGRLELFTPGGNHLRTSQVNFKPSFMDFVDAPIGLVFAAAEANDEGGANLLILRSNVPVTGLDTLLSASHGPEVLRGASLNTSKTSVVASERGVWVWSDVRPDTLYEITGQAGERRLEIQSDDWQPAGVLADKQRGIVWMVTADTSGIRYSAYDVSGQGLLTGDRYLGRRTTRPGFTPQATFDGAVLGWKHSPQIPFLAAAYDMLVDELPSRTAEEGTED
ncbi:MAG: hypothetical protein ABFS14_12790 [Gemmatimonadota bacterium]